MMTKEEKLDQLNEAFSPTVPIEQRDLFYGRYEQLTGLHSAVSQRGAHAALYGDRGVGKTSLANMAATVLPWVTVSKVTCSRHDDFRSLWNGALNKIRF